MTLTEKITRLANVSRKLAVTETIYRELGNLWATSAVYVDLHGVDHDAIHAVAEIQGEPSHRGYDRGDGSPGVIYVRTGGDGSPLLYGLANGACQQCRLITGADAPAPPEGVP
jgi:hypothetical protein